MSTVTIAPETLDAAFADCKSILDVVHALYELVLPGLDLTVQGTSPEGGFPRCSPETWDMIQEAAERWMRTRSRSRGGVKDLKGAWDFQGNLNYGFEEVSGISFGVVDTSTVVVIERKDVQ